MECPASDVIEVMRILYQKGLITVLSGNASVRCGNHFLITPSGTPKHKISELALVNLNTLEWVGPKPSIEYRMHAQFYLKSNFKAVVHAHNPMTVLLADVKPELLDPSPYVESRYAIKRIGVVERLEAGSEELALAVGREVEKGADVVVMKGHGAIAGGKDPYDALNKIEALEYLSALAIEKLKLRSQT
ncbi:aldolase [Ignicoccus pacificus DSM 13166]|uniref:Aldolase n=1 Tax=Ignicoccus pacificus DSM 13166 TaxID=940294 RepID=A0A977K9U1_9CREN|nr:aldolase [Ignicoccus pacificus DSM 13166]